MCSVKVECRIMRTIRQTTDMMDTIRRACPNTMFIPCAIKSHNMG